jgi:hypothetical protein
VCIVAYTTILDDGKLNSTAVRGKINYLTMCMYRGMYNNFDDGKLNSTAVRGKINYLF